MLNKWLFVKLQIYLVASSLSTLWNYRIILIVKLQRLVDYPPPSMQFKQLHHKLIIVTPPDIPLVELELTALKF
jgi:hypothetical protein